jgi:four helix bundle protein
MATFKRFEEIEAWQEARKLVKQLYSLSSSEKFSRDFALRDQVRRASVSIMANIAEGYERGGSGEFIQFLSIAKGSAAEVKSHLYVALDQEYVGEQRFNELMDRVEITARKLSKLIEYLRGSEIKGVKYKA